MSLVVSRYLGHIYKKPKGFIMKRYNKRDDAYLADCKGAKKVLKMLSEWFADYKEKATNSALKMMSPLQYRSAN